MEVRAKSDSRDEAPHLPRDVGRVPTGGELRLQTLLIHFTAGELKRSKNNETRFSKAGRRNRQQEGLYRQYSTHMSKHKARLLAKRNRAALGPHLHLLSAAPFFPAPVARPSLSAGVSTCRPTSASAWASRTSFPIPLGTTNSPFPQTRHSRGIAIPSILRKMATSTTPQPAVVSPEEQAKLVEASKRLAAFQAVSDHLLPEYTRIGIGSGSTVVYVVEAIAALNRAITSRMTFYPTGAQSEELIEAAGLTLQSISKLPAGQQLDVAFDGADEVDDELNLIKGGGACLWQEKIVAASARRFVCVADFRKLSPRLGTSWKKGIPIEVLPLAAPRVLDELRRLGSVNPAVRPGLPGKAGAVVTDNGMWIIDAPFAPLRLAKDGAGAGGGVNGVWTVDELADRLIKIPGVAEIGLFYGKNGLEVASGAQKPVAAYFGMADGTVRKLEAPPAV